ncbi:MAG: LOG family protein [Myxococcota bacterium]
MPPTEKAYKDLRFLNSPGARHIRILCEYEEPRLRFREQEVRDTIVIFGSARVRPREEAEAALARAERDFEGMAEEADRARARAELAQARRMLRMSRFYEDTRALAARLTKWTVERTGGRKYLVCSGGGPGIMEASNRGASEVEGGRSVGLGISLPFEEKVNDFVTPELAFQFHYFFMRKYWFAYLAKAMVIMPGGFGTLDEMFEVLTLRQTGKIKKRLPMVLFGKEYWDAIIDMDQMVEWGTIAARDISLVFRTDSVDEAFDYLTSELESVEREELSK